MTIDQLFSGIQEKTVLVVGDVMIDSYIFGSKGTSDSVPVLSEKKKEKRLGGAANVALNVSALGATPILCSVVGDDHSGQNFEFMLKEQGMPNKGIIRSQNRKTSTKLRILSGSQQLIRVDSEDVHPLADLDRKALLNHINNLAGESDLIIFEDYDKGTVHSEIISETIGIAKKLNIPVVVDPKSKNFFSYKGATLFKPSIAELEANFAGNPNSNDEAQILEIIESLDKKIKAKNYLISFDGGDIFFYSDQCSKLFPTHHTGVADMSGVGNAIISVAGLALTLGLKPEAIAELSNIAAGIVAKYSGVVPISKDLLVKEASENQLLVKYL